MCVCVRAHCHCSPSADCLRSRPPPLRSLSPQTGCPSVTKQQKKQKLRGENKHNIKENVCVWRSKKCVTHRQLLGQFDHHVLQIILQTLELLIGGLEEVRTAA